MPSTPRRPKTEEQLQKAVAAKAKRGFITLTAWEQVRKSMTTSTGWSTKEFDAWFASQAQKGTFRVAASNRAAGTKTKQNQAMQAVQEEQRGKACTMRKVRKWVSGRAEGKQITAAMVRQMEHNLRETGGTTKRVAAAIILVAAEDDMIIEDRRQGSGRAPRDWAKETLEWATQKGWVTAKQAAKAAQAVQQHPRQAGGKTHEAVCLELGSGWEGATEGLRQVYDRVVTMDMDRQRISNQKKAAPDFLVPFEQARDKLGGTIAWMTKRAGVRQGELQAVWASPSCKEETAANAINKGKQGAAGHFTGQPRSAAAQEGLDAMLQAITEATEKDPRVQVCIENPWVTALALETDITDRWGQGEKVMGCAYGAPTMKLYRLWMTPAIREEFKKVRIDPRSKLSRCEACKQGRKHTMTVLPGMGQKRKRTRVEGLTVQAARNRVPPALAKQVGECMQRAYEGTFGG